MDARNEFRDFLTSRRARITPEQAGLPAYSGIRRVPGLRREEVALLAGMSVDYYIRLERGNAHGVSETVLEGLTAALRLDDDERSHLFALARAVNASAHPPAPRRTPKPQVRPSVERILDGMTLPAYVRNRRMDVLAANQLGKALMSPVLAGPSRPANLARFLFLDAAAPRYYPDWESAAGDIVALLRGQASVDPNDKSLQDLVGGLATRSEMFRTRWAAHNVRFHHNGAKRVHHPVVGELELSFDTLELPADSGLSMVVYSAEPDTASYETLAFLASWAAVNGQDGDGGIAARPPAPGS